MGISNIPSLTAIDSLVFISFPLVVIFFFFLKKKKKKKKM